MYTFKTLQIIISRIAFGAQKIWKGMFFSKVGFKIFHKKKNNI